MAASAQYSVTVRVEFDARQEPLGKLTASVAEAGGSLKSRSTSSRVRVPRASGSASSRSTPTASGRPGSRSCARSAPREARGSSASPTGPSRCTRRGKIEQHNKYPLKTRDDLSMAYTPGVARVCQYIAADKDQGLRLHDQGEHGGRGLRRLAVLGLGDIGPEAAMPVMEGKAMLFKEFGDVDAFRSAWIPTTRTRSSGPSS